MSRQELAEAVNAYVFTATRRVYAMDAHYVGRLERGARRWPNADYRTGFRAVLGVDTDSALGFFRSYRAADEVTDEGSGVSEQVSDDLRSIQLVVPPGTAVLLAPVDYPVVLSVSAGPGSRGDHLLSGVFARADHSPYPLSSGSS
jgi:hypothetical protein